MKIKLKLTMEIILIALILLLLNTKVNAAQTATTTDGSNTIEWSYNLDGDTIKDLKCTNKSSISGSITIPDTIDGYTVRKLGTEAFYKCTGLTGVTISNNVTVLGDWAFKECSGLSNIVMGNKLVEIGSQAFEGCSGLSSVTIPDSVTTIGTRAFYECAGLREVTLPKNLTAIKSSTFGYCRGLTTLVIPEGVTSILGSSFDWYGAFYQCSSLKSILIPNSVNYIDVYAFNGCSADLTIYGDKDSTAYQFAIDHNIAFDYTENYGKTTGGTDITGPTITGIQIPSSNVANYYESATSMYKVPSGAELIINVIFDEEITGDTVPTLVLTCGTGDDIKLTKGTVGKDTITYTYTVKTTDKGTLQVKELTGGNITDKAGNEANLNRVDLKVVGSSSVVYLNGEAVVVNNNNSNKSTESNNATTSPTTTSNTTQTDDTTIKVSKLPQTGEAIAVIIAIIAVSGLLVFLYFKYKMMSYIK